MFSKFIHSQNDHEAELGDAALHDIIPSNDVFMDKKYQGKRCRKICKMVSFIVMLGLITFGIVLLILIFVYSHFILINVFGQSSKVLSNDNEKELIDDSSWQKITVPYFEYRNRIDLSMATNEKSSEAILTTESSTSTSSVHIELSTELTTFLTGGNEEILGNTKYTNNYSSTFSDSNTKPTTIIESLLITSSPNQRSTESDQLKKTSIKHFPKRIVHHDDFLDDLLFF